MKFSCHKFIYNKSSWFDSFSSGLKRSSILCCSIITVNIAWEREEQLQNYPIKLALYQKNLTLCQKNLTPYQKNLAPYQKNLAPYQQNLIPCQKNLAPIRKN